MLKSHIGKFGSESRECYERGSVSGGKVVYEKYFGNKAIKPSNVFKGGH